MTTTIKVSYTGQSKAVVCATSIESDELTADEINELSYSLYIKASRNAEVESMKKLT